MSARCPKCQQSGPDVNIEHQSHGTETKVRLKCGMCGHVGNWVETG